MREKGVTQKDLSIELGLSTRAAVGHYFTGRSEPSISQLGVIAKRLGVSPSYLLSDQDSDIDYEALESSIILITKSAQELGCNLTDAQSARLTAHIYKQILTGIQVNAESIKPLIRLMHP